MNALRLGLALLLSSLLVPLAPALAADPPIRAPQMLKGEDPAPGEIREVTVGEAIYTKFDYVEFYGARIPAGYRSEFMLGRIVIPPGTLFVERPTKRGKVQYCSRERLYHQGRILNDIVCFKDENGDGSFEQIRVPNLRFGRFAKIKKTPPIPYVEGVDQEMTNGFQQELLYQGVAGDALSISYREFVESMARPAFQQDLSYTLEAEGTTEIGFKGARFEVLEATNTSIRLKVISGIP